VHIIISKHAGIISNYYYIIVKHDVSFTLNFNGDAKSNDITAILLPLHNFDEIMILIKNSAPSRKSPEHLQRALGRKTT